MAKGSMELESLLLFTYLRESMDIVTGKRLHSSVEPFATQVRISHYFRTVEPFNIGVYHVVEPFAIHTSRCSTTGLLSKSIVSNGTTRDFVARQAANKDWQAVTHDRLTDRQTN